MTPSSVYFNENDPYAAEWLGNLYPDARVDTRSIVDVQPDDLMENGGLKYKHTHFFAGIAGWEYALQLAGWPAGQEVWTGSCPCQPFSNAGRGKRVEDERHLWPEFLRLISICRPTVVFGEQVASKAGREWLSGVRTDLEALGYVVGCADLSAASVGAPHIRQRLYWVARHSGTRLERPAGACISRDGPGSPRRSAAGAAADGLANASSAGVRDPRPGTHDGQASGAEGNGPQRQRFRTDSGYDCGGTDGAGSCGGYGQRGPWSSYDLVPCRDGKTRRIESGLQPLVDGIPFLLADGRTREGVSRAQVLKGIGNAIVPPLAAEFIRAFMDVMRDGSLD